MLQWLTSIFTHVGLLWWVLAVSIPLIIELLFRLHRRRVELPTIRWLLKHKDQKKIKRQNRLLIIIRSVLIGFLVLAVARPRVGKDLLGGVRERQVVVLIDGTTSMGQNSGAGSAFDLARQKAEALVRGLSDETTVTVGLVADRFQVVAGPTKDHASAADAVHGLRRVGGAAPISDGLEWAIDVLPKDKKEASETYVVSDFARATWLSGEPAGQLLSGLGQRGALFLIDVAPERTYNVTFTQFEPVEPLASVGMQVEFRANLVAFGTPPDPGTPAPTIAVTFLVDGEKKGRTDLAASPAAAGRSPAGPIETWSVLFKHTFSKPGEYLVAVEASGDENPLDNRREYLISVPAEQRVLIFDPTAPLAAAVSAAPVAGALDPAARERKSYFLQEAVAPDVSPGQDKVTHFSATIRHPSEAERENLGAYCAVVFVGLEEIPEILARNCEVYVHDGGSCLIFLDETANRFDYKRKLATARGEAGGPCLMPVTLGAPLSPGGTVLLNLAARAGAGAGLHPALAAFAGESIPDAAAARVLRYMPLTLAENAKVVASFTDESGRAVAPAIVENRFGDGRVCLFNFTADARWADLVGLTQWLPLVQETLRYVVGNPDRGVNLEVGQTYHQPVLKTSQHLMLIAPDRTKERLTPKARRGLAPPSDGSSRAETRPRPAAPAAPPPELAGWEISYIPSQQGVYRLDARRGEVLRPRFVANVPAAEGDPGRLALADVRSAFAGVPFTWLTPADSTAELVAKRYAVIEAAVMLLWLVAALLALESLLAALWGRRRGIGVVRKKA